MMKKVAYNISEKVKIGDKLSRLYPLPANQNTSTFVLERIIYSTNDFLREQQQMANFTESPNINIERNQKKFSSRAANCHNYELDHLGEHGERDVFFFLFFPETLLLKKSNLREYFSN